MTAPSPPPHLAAPAPRVRPELDALAGYVAGKRPAERGGPVFKLSSNEAVAAPGAARDAAALELEGLHLYPDMTGAAVRSAIAAHHGVDAGCVALGAGSAEVLSQAIRAVSGPGDRVVYPWRSFEAYPLLVTGAGAVPHPVPLAADGSNDLDGLRAAIDETTTCVLVCTPNNPTGSSLAPAALAAFIDAMPPHVLILVDEAYLQFDEQEGLLDVVALAAARPNVLAVRTFSKAYGLAGLRIGYAIGDPRLVAAMNKLALPFGVSAAAQAGAIAALRDDSGMRSNVAQAVANRARVQSALAEAGISSPASAANFVWLPCTASAVPGVVAAFEAHGVLVRPFPEGVRVSVGGDAATEAVLAALPEVAVLLRDAQDGGEA